MVTLVFLFAFYVQCLPAAAVLSSSSGRGPHRRRGQGEVVEFTNAQGQGAFFHRPNARSARSERRHVSRGLLDVKDGLAHDLGEPTVVPASDSEKRNVAQVELKSTTDSLNQSHGPSSRGVGDVLPATAEGAGHPVLVQLSDRSVQSKVNGSSVDSAAASTGWTGPGGTCEQLQAMVSAEGQSWTNVKHGVRLHFSCSSPTGSSSRLQLADSSGASAMVEFGLGDFQTWRRHNTSYFALYLSPDPDNQEDEKKGRASIGSVFPEGSHDFLLRGRYDKGGHPLGEIGLVANSNTHAISFRPVKT